MDSSWAKPGAQCVCIAAPWTFKRCGARNFWRRLWTWLSRHPKINETCIVRGVVSTDGLTMLVLEGYPVARYSAEHFRPLVGRTQEHDLALFRHHLTGAPAPEVV